MKKNLLYFVFLFISGILFAFTLKMNFELNKPSKSLKNKPSQSCEVSNLLASISCVKSGNWNDPTTWSTNSVPTASDDVLIGASFTVIPNGSCTAGSITVMGELRTNAGNTNFSLTTRGIMVTGASGLFRIGRPSAPYTGTATITLTGSNTSEVLFTGMGTKVLGSMNGGTIRMEGVDKKSWTNLNVDAAVGATQITVKEPVGWLVGDEIVIVSSRADWNEAEKRTITAVSADKKTFSFTTGLAYPHVGTSYNYTRDTDNKTWTGDLRAEVGLLSHNIKIQGDDASDTNSFGGHVMAHQSGKLYISNVELYRMGQKSRNGRYPIHWHMLHTDGNGQYLKNSSIHKSFNRAVTIHGTHGTLVENNFAYDHIGHGIFLENGSEINNTIKGNVVLLTKRPAPGEQLTPSDNSHDEVQNRTPASYWITNPNNSFTNNVAAGTQGTGFWYALTQSFLFESATDSRFVGQTPAYKEIFGGFSDNIAHSCMSGFDIFDRLDDKHAILANESWDEPNAKVFSNNTWYANDLGVYSGIGGGRALSSLFTFSNNVFVENLVSIMFASYNIVDESVFVANSGQNLISGERFLYRTYDGAGTVKNSYFVGWNASNSNFLLNTGAAIKHPNHTFENITFDHAGTIRAAFPDFSNPTSGYADANDIGHPRFWINVIKDNTGSLSGIPNSSIVCNHPFMLAGGETQPTNWTNIFSTPRSFALSLLNYNIPYGQIPNVSVTRTKLGTPTASVYYIYGYNEHHQLPVIVNDNFLYTYQYENLPTTKLINHHVFDANVGDTYISRYKDFGKLGGLTVNASTGVFTAFTSLAALQNSTGAGFYKEPLGDLYIKTKATQNDQHYTIQWVTNFVVSPLDTDGDGYIDSVEAQNNRLPTDAFDLGFTFSNNTDGWQTSGTIASASIANSSYQIQSNGNDPQLIRTNLSFEANSVPVLFADIKSNATGTFQLFWTTEDDSTLSESKSVTVNYNTANQRSLISFNLASHPLWAGKKIKQLRLDQPSTTALTNVYFIGSSSSKIDTDGDGMLDIEEAAQCRNHLNSSDFGINYNSPNYATGRFGTANISNFEIVDGIVRGTSLSGDPHFYPINSNLNFNGSIVPKLKLRIKASTATTIEFFWANEDGYFAGSRRTSASYTTPGMWQEIVFDLSTNTNWIGKSIKDFRIDPGISSNISFEIDWIRSFNYTECSTNACEPTILAVPLLTENKWTYYGLAGSNNYLFALEHKPEGGNTANFSAAVTLKKQCDSNNSVHQASNSATKAAVFVAGYYWNINLTSGSTNGFVNTRFFPDSVINQSLETVSNNFFTNVGAVYKSPSMYFYANNVLTLPNDIRADAKGLNYGFMPLQINTTGIYNNKNYVQFNNISNLHQSAGGLMQLVTNANESTFADPQLLKGTLRYNNVLHRFEGYDGKDWVRFGKK